MTDKSSKGGTLQGARAGALADLRQRIGEHADRVHRQVAHLPVSLAQRGSVVTLLDASGSMAGQKFEQAKLGLLDFATASLSSGYEIGVVVFASDARVLCRPTRDRSLLTTSLNEARPGGSTNLKRGLELAGRLIMQCSPERVFLVVTDGMPDGPADTLAAAERAKAQGIRIVTIGTDDADRDFLARLATAPDFSAHVQPSELRAQLTSVHQLLLGSSGTPRA